MSQLRVNFLNWRPDLEAAGHDGLVTADNVLHDTEGYKDVLQQTAVAFATTSAFTAGFGLNVISLHIEPLSNVGRYGVAALVPSAGGTTVTFSAGITGTDLTGTNTAETFATSQVSTTTLLSARACRILSFSIAELNEAAAFVGHATAELQGGTTFPMNISGIVEYSVD